MNILYGIPGEGMGHATRSKVVIDHLLKSGHSVIAVSSGRAFHFLDKAFPGRVIEIRGFHFAYRNAEVSKSATLLSNLRGAARNLVYNTGKKLMIEKTFSPDLVISDFESFSYFFARAHKLPVISIDNMQVMDRCVLDIQVDPSEKNNYRIAKNIVRAKVPGCDHYFVTSFFPAETRKSNTSVVPPIIRQAILDARPRNGDHILMYQTSSTLTTVKKVLHQLPGEKFIVYGMNQDQADGNVVFRPFSESGFIADLSGARAVIANGGFSFISEAVYLRKPVYAFPIRKQFEQWMNARYIDKMGCGRHFDSLSADELKAFVYDLPVFEKALAAQRQDGNQELFKALDSMLSGLVRG